MQETVRECLVESCKSEGYGSDDSDLYEALWDAEEIYREEVSKHRWWNEYLYVVKISGVFIGYIHAEANRDESVSALGYEFDPLTICQMVPIRKTIIVYEPAKECVEEDAPTKKSGESPVMKEEAINCSHEIGKLNIGIPAMDQYHLYDKESPIDFQVQEIIVKHMKKILRKRAVAKRKKDIKHLHSKPSRGMPISSFHM